MTEEEFTGLPEPVRLKAKFAWLTVAEFHGVDAANAAMNEFFRVYWRKRRG